MKNSALRKNTSLVSHVVRQCLLGTGLAVCAVSAHAQSKDIDDGIEDLYITVESGDTFTGIVSRELVTLDAWGEIARFNKLESPDNLSPGDVIVIPAEALRRRNYAKVVFVKGKAIHHIAASNTKEELVKGAKIYAGDLIETDKDGFVSMSFSGGSSVNVQPESKLRINVIKCVDKEEACEINLDSEAGQLGVDVQSVGFKKPTVFSIDSPYASAAVRGTRFDFDINAGNALGVTHGSVEISLNGISNNIDIGKGVLAGEGRSINDTFDLLGLPPLRLTDEVNRVSKEDIISWGQVDGAKKYLVAYAPSEAAQEVVLSLAETDNVTKPELPTGNYVVSTRAVDSNGLRGFSAEKKIASVKIDEKAVAPELDLVVTGSEMQLKADATSGAFEVKLGNRLETIDSIEYLVTLTTHQLKAGETIKVPIDPSKQWYIQSRKIVNNNTVSPYGALYFFDK